MKLITIVTIILLAAATWCTYKLHGSPMVGIDDANIFFTYAENLAAGNGIRYAQNPGQVEGFTSMLWMLLSALIFFLGLNEFAVLVLSFALLVITHWLLLKTIQACVSENKLTAWPYQAIYIALILCAPAYITWMTITLMDTCLWGLTIAGMTYFVLLPPHSRRSWLMATIPFALAPLSRPEGLLVAPIFIALLWFRSNQSHKQNDATRYCFSIALAFLIVASALTIFRLLYFGYPFPNTYYAKVSPSPVYNLWRGTHYLIDFILSGTVIGIGSITASFCCAAWLSAAMGRIRRHRSLKPLFNFQMKASVAVSFGSLTLLVLPVLTGGDHFAMSRFFQPAYPLLCLATIFFLVESQIFTSIYQLSSREGSWHKARALIAMGAFLACWLFSYAANPSWRNIQWGSPLDFEFRLAEMEIAKGKQLMMLFRQLDNYPSLGVIVAGGIARTYPGPIIDLMGLNNNLIAHYRGDRKGLKNHAAFEKDAFFLVSPDVVLASLPSPPETTNYLTTILKDIHKDPRFIELYRYGTLYQRGTLGNTMTVFVKKRFVESIANGSGLFFDEKMIWSDKWVAAPALPRGKAGPHQ